MDLQTTPNLRDLGGTRTRGGSVLRPHRVARSAVPFETDASPEDLPWPPSVVIDLRSTAELRQYPTLPTAPTAVHLPLLSQLKPGPHLDGTLVALYKALLDAVPDMLVDLVRTVADSEGPALIHCAAGKDRTGISIALLLRLLDVDRDVVMEDYLLTNEFLDDVHARLGALPGNEDRSRLPREYFHVVPDALEAVLDTWDAHRGGVRGWLADAGAEADLVDRLERSLLEPGS